VDGRGAIEFRCQDAGLCPKGSNSLVRHGPESPEHGCAEDKTSARAVEYHVCFPSVLHVTSTCNLEEPKDSPEEEEDKTVCQ